VQGVAAFGRLDMGKAKGEVEAGGVGLKADKAPRRPDPAQGPPKPPNLCYEERGNLLLLHHAQVHLGVEHHAYILFRLRDVNRSGESDSDAEEWTDASGSDDGEEEDPGWKAWKRVHRNLDRQVDSYMYAAHISSESGAEAKGGASGGGASSLAGQQAGESTSAVATTAGQGRLDLVMQALEVRTPEALAALVVVSADTYRLPLEETATIAVDQLRFASFSEDADKLWRALVKALRDKLNEESAGTREAKEEEEEEEEEGEEEEEEILGKGLEWGDPVVRRGPLQKPVRIKDWKIDPANLNWGAQLSRYSEVSVEQREQGKGKEKVPDSGPSRPQHARSKGPTDSEGDEHWIATEKKANMKGDEMVTGKDRENQRFDRPGFHPNDPLPFPGLGEIGRFWRDVEVLGQVVAMQSRHNKDLKARFFGRHNLWRLWVLSTVFLLGVPLIVIPAVETFFAAELVRAAIPGLVESNRSLGLAALAASKGLEVTDNLQYADTPHLASLVRAARVREEQTEGREGWTEDEKATADMLYQSFIVRGRWAEGAVAAAIAREELEQLNPNLLDKASGGPSAAGEPGPESEGKGGRGGRGGGRGLRGGLGEGYLVDFRVYSSSFGAVERTLRAGASFTI
jgi:hypothetical protein